MAIDQTTGTEKLIERILADAHAAAEQVMAQSRAESAAVMAQAEHECAEILDAATRKGQRMIADMLDRSRTNAELDGRKYALEKRRAALQDVFNRAYLQLCDRKGETRDRLLVGLALREADGGETILPAPADRENMKRLLVGINKSLEQAGKAPLTLDDADTDMDAGFLLSCASYEKDCSFAAVMAEMRSTLESDVFGILFGGK